MKINYTLLKTILTKNSLKTFLREIQIWTTNTFLN